MSRVRNKHKHCFVAVVWFARLVGEGAMAFDGRECYGSRCRVDMLSTSVRLFKSFVVLSPVVTKKTVFLLLSWRGPAAPKKLVTENGPRTKALPPWLLSC